MGIVFNKNNFSSVAAHKTIYEKLVRIAEYHCYYNPPYILEKIAHRLIVELYTTENDSFEIYGVRFPKEYAPNLDQVFVFPISNVKDIIIPVFYTYNLLITYKPFDNSIETKYRVLPNAFNH